MITPGYVLFNLHSGYQKGFLRLNAAIDNLLNKRYDTFATFFDNAAFAGNPAFPNLSDTRTVSPAKPFAVYGGVKLSF